MRSTDIIDPNDSLTCADVQHTDQPIDVYEELMNRGFNLQDENLFTSTESRYTDYFCTRIITNSAAGIGGVARLELYQNRDDPRRGFAVVYQILKDTHAGLLVRNKFISNDPGYRRRHFNRMTEVVSATREGVQRVSLS